ncbi:MAG: hypothetical protein ACI9CB_002716, partial [Rhodothermales bacterium]
RAFIENYLQNLDQPVDINELFKLSTAETLAERFQLFVEKGKLSTELSTEEICAIRPLVHAHMARQARGTLFVKSHNFLGEYKGFPLHNSSVTSGAIYIVRNPLDVAVSMANYFSYPIDEAIYHMAEEMSGTPNEALHVPQIMSSWSSHVQSWTAKAEAQILVLKYEKMLANPLKEFRKVVSFLGQRKDLKRLQKAVRFSSFKQLKAQEVKRGFVEKFENAQSFFRHGQQNEWREKLSDTQVRRIVNDHFEQMERFKYLPPEFLTDK